MPLSSSPKHGHMNSDLFDVTWQMLPWVGGIEYSRKNPSHMVKMNPLITCITKMTLNKHATSQRNVSDDAILIQHLQNTDIFRCCPTLWCLILWDSYSQVFPGHLLYAHPCTEDTTVNQTSSPSSKCLQFSEITNKYGIFDIVQEVLGWC